MKPVSIKIKNKKLQISWNNSSEDEIELIKLRKLCPCATCIAERDEQSKSFIPLFQQSQLKITSINIVGNYALQIKWQDGHNTGIYEYPYLKKLSEDLAS